MIIIVVQIFHLGFKVFRFHSETCLAAVIDLMIIETGTPVRW